MSPQQASPSRSSEETTAVLLMAHGSRRQEANDDLASLAEMIRQQAEYRIVEIAYLEIAQPTIPEGARNCEQQGANRVLMLPFFLSAGSHVVEDLQRHQRELAEEFSDILFELCPPLGLHPLIVDIVLDRLRERITTA